ncbi:MAG: NADH-quinone oxidoreductase subunit C [Candidatus Angelobacter sp.]
MSSRPQERVEAPGAADATRLLQAGARLVSIFGSVEDDSTRVRYIVDVPGSGYRVLEQAVRGALPSLTPITPAAAWYERELQDQYAVKLTGHPDPRRLMLHDNWPRDVYPMAAAVETVPWADEPYQFLKVEGEGVCEVAVGPVHASIIEPGHFRFSVMGDNVLYLELRHFYTHKGTEKLFQGTPVAYGPMIAESVSGDNCFAHAVAYSQAVEQAHGIAVPRQAQLMRLIGLELERMIAHIGDVGALSNDVAFVLPAAYCSRVKEDLMKASAQAMNTRFWKGIALPGGVARTLAVPAVEILQRAVKQAADEFAKMANIILDRPSVQGRFEGAGVLRRAVAEDLAAVGLVARASGMITDVRHDHPYGAYRDLQLEVPSLGYGDVLARARIRIEEAAVSARLILDALRQLAPGPITAELPQAAAFEGFSAVESPRGELLYWVKGEGGKLSRCHIKSPSFQNWPALPHAVIGNVIADFPLINKSFNLSYSGCDR